MINLKTLAILSSGLLSFLPLSAYAVTNRCSEASFYGVGDGFHGRRTANGERFNAHGITAAHKTLPFGTRLIVRNLSNNKTVVVKINDRGPYAHGRDLDLSYGAFTKIASASQGVAKICYSVANS